MSLFPHDDIDEAVLLPGRAFTRAHLFKQRDISAIEAALASRRPLLLRGEPGTGKSQLAEAAAIVLKRPYVSFVIDQRTEVRDLHWREDMVQRLADAQIQRSQASSLPIEDYVEPGPLWWAFNWSDAESLPRARVPALAKTLPQQTEANGVVVLIDEIDKADPDLPNGLLEALGSGEFTPRGRNAPVMADETRWPLIVITTNRERALPDAFLRRCVVHDILLPEDDVELRELLVARGARHFPDADRDVLDHAADLTLKDRTRAKAQRLYPLPGQAEYLDLLRAVHDPAFSDPMLELERLAPFFLEKKTDHRA